jgi:hypothetical protein
MDQCTRTFNDSAYPQLLQISVPVIITDQRTRTFYGSAYRHILRISVPAHFMDQRTRTFYESARPYTLRISVRPLQLTDQRTYVGGEKYGLACALPYPYANFIKVVVHFLYLLLHCTIFVSYLNHSQINHRAKELNA